jgi:predicted  nucleic acid-binding Zn-ribbon protein
MAEVEVGGIKFKGGKMLVFLTALSAVGGGLWAGFEFWKDYQDLQETVLSYTAPDLSGFDKRLAVQNQTVDAIAKEMGSVRLRVAEIQQLSRDLREDVRSDSAKLYEALGAVDRRSRDADAETRAAMRQAEKILRDITASASERFDSKINGVDAKLDALETRLNRTLQRALDNPLLKGQ